VIRQAVLYSGQVQGVGFRAAALWESRGFRVTGYVRNLDDGRVELVAEGEAGQVEGFLSAVRERMAGSIRHEAAEQGRAEGLWDGFHIAP
jgi:acylphosphatase